jgi:uncharacterized membrane protein
VPGVARANSFQALGFLPGNSFSVAEGLSSDGSTVVGYSNSGKGPSAKPVMEVPAK